MQRPTVRSPEFPLALPVWVALASLIVVVYVVGLGRMSVAPRDLDAVADWLTARAVLDGIDPYTDITDLAAHYRVDYSPNISADTDPVELGHPRAPGALLIQLPLGLVPVGFVYGAVFGVSVLCQGAAVFLIARKRAWRPQGAALATLVVGVSAPALAGYRFATQSAILALLLAVVLAHWERPEGGLGPLALALAGTLKVFPLLIVFVMLKYRRWRPAMWTAGGVLALNALPLAHPSISLSRAIETITNSVGVWFRISGNMSVASHVARLAQNTALVPGLVAFLVLGMGGIALVSRARSETADGALVLVFALLVGPVAWSHYLLVLVPWLLGLLEGEPKRWQWAAALLVALVSIQAVSVHYTIGLCLLAVYLMFRSPVYVYSEIADA